MQWLCHVWLAYNYTNLILLNLKALNSSDAKKIEHICIDHIKKVNIA